MANEILAAFVGGIIGGLAFHVYERWAKRRAALKITPPCYKPPPAALLIVFLLSASSAHAQSLRTATQVFAATAAADWTTTGIGLSRRTFTEINPALAWTHSDPALTVAAGAAMDVAGVWALHRFVGRKHPRIAAVALYAQSAARVYFVSRGARFIAEQGAR